jgi:hypothetical protein
MTTAMVLNGSNLNLLGVQGSAPAITALAGLAA